MKKFLKNIALIFCVLGLAVVFQACENQGSAEKAGEETGEKVDTMMEKAKENLEEAGDKMGEMVEKGGEEMQKVGEKMQE